MHGLPILSWRIDPLAPDRDARLLEVAAALAPGWAGVRQAPVEVVGGGITNLLFRLSAAGLPTVLVRIYGENTERVIDREREIALFARLSAMGFAPPLYGRFENGRVEGFLEGFRALEPQEMGSPELRRKIAARLAELHRIPPEPASPGLWSTLERWMDAARSVEFTGERARRHAALNLALRADQLAALRERFERRYAGLWPCRPVLAHNDLLAGNVLLHEGRGEVRFIDYEYSGCSYAAFDIANHFCEHAGFDSDFERNYPGEATREDFLDAYLGEDSSAETRQEWAEAVRFFVLPDHLFWGSWAVVQARYSPIDFDFLGYADLRMKGLDLHLRSFGPLT